MSRRIRRSAWARAFERSFLAITRNTLKAAARAAGLGRKTQTRALGFKAPAQRRRPPPGAGDWLAGLALGAAGARRYRLYRPPGVALGERLPLLVMLHGCGQDAGSFAMATRMNRVAARERFLVLYPEQDRMANAQGCWNWFDTRSGRAYGEAQLIMTAVEQVCLLYPVDRDRIAIAGLSAGASMAALLVTRHPGRFKAVMMHSGIPPGAANSTLTAVRAMHGGRTAMPLATPAAAVSWPPLMVIHGRADAVVSRANAQAAAQAWGAAVGARAGPSRSVRRGERYPMTITDFKLRRSTVATLVEVEQLGHAWSGGAAGQPNSDARGPDASRMMWSFATKQFPD
jgi:poly(hydroxyalkanoate) depolymerase family esterase